MPFVPERIFVERGLEDCTVALRARRAAINMAMEVFEDLSTLLARFETVPAAEAKKSLVVARRAGGFVKEFPSGPGLTASGWRYFIPAIGCPADCRYCFLQTYHPAGVPVVFADQDALLSEVADRARELGGGYFYGGELCDNLILERYMGLVARLVELFRGMPEATLELRTKSDEVEPLLAAGPAPNVTIAWTFSPREIAETCERGVPHLDERIAAARRVQDAGFRVGIRLDPIVLDDGWQDAYRCLLTKLSGALNPRMVESVHLGCMRYTPALKAAAVRRFGRGAPFAGEFVQSRDGKFRYPRPARAAAYGGIAKMVHGWAEGIPIRLVMETPEVTQDFKRLAR
jgi:spore photoproduct lyase